MFIEYLWKRPDLYFTWIVVVVFSICVHETAHAWMAARQGDHTPAEAGYLSMNPLKLMGPRSLLFMALLGIAWGSVPVSPRRYRHRYSAALVSAAGPLANLMLSLIFAVLTFTLTKNMADTSDSNMFLLVTTTGLRANCLLFIFNLLPVPMLDGWKVLSFFIPFMERVSDNMKAQFTLIVFLLLVFTPAFQFIWKLAFLMSHSMLKLLSLIAG